MKNKKKQIPGLNTRAKWIINPRTRIQDNDIRKNKKKLRQSGRKITTVIDN
jgi:hypothetical protein